MGESSHSLDKYFGRNQFIAYRWYSIAISIEPHQNCTELNNDNDNKHTKTKRIQKKKKKHTFLIDIQHELDIYLTSTNDE